MLVVTLFLFVDFSLFFLWRIIRLEREGGRGGWKLDLISRSLDRWIHLYLSTSIYHRIGHVFVCNNTLELNWIPLFYWYQWGGNCLLRSVETLGLFVPVLLSPCPTARVPSCRAHGMPAGQGAGAVKMVGNDKHSRCFTFYLLLWRIEQRVVRDSHELALFGLG